MVEVGYTPRFNTIRGYGDLSYVAPCGPFGMINHIATYTSMYNLYLDHSCNKYCDLIGKEEPQVSIFHRYL